MSDNFSYDVVVVGAGVGGVSAALAAARGGARVALLEAAPEIGGTGVHSPVGLVCTWFDKAHRFINRGIFEEFLPYLYIPGLLEIGVVQTYDEQELQRTYRRLLEAEPLLEVFTFCAVTEVLKEAETIRAVRTADGRVFSARVFVDGTADGNLAALAGATVQKGRELDGRLQPGTLTFRVEGVDFTAFGLDPSKPNWICWEGIPKINAALQPLFTALREAGGTSNPRTDILCFPDRFGKSLLFNQTRVAGVDPSDPASIERAMTEGQKQVREFWEAVRVHPAFARVTQVKVSQKFGIREGRRVIGDYILTGPECLGEARFEDMVVACGYPVDIHDPAGTGKTEFRDIPGSGYYHIPYRCLYSKDLTNLLVGSRCISTTHEAHSSYRVMPPVSAVGQAAGVAAALAIRHGKAHVREVPAAWIRHVLRASNQFVEGECVVPQT